MIRTLQRCVSLLHYKAREGENPLRRFGSLLSNLDLVGGSINAPPQSDVLDQERLHVLVFVPP